MLKKLKNKIKNYFKEVLMIKTSPNSIAWGFAVGTFFGIVPTFGTEAIIIFLILLIFRKISKISLVASYVLWNPLLTIPIYALSYKIGDLFLENLPTKIFKIELLNKIWFYSQRVIVGSLSIAIIFSVASYFIIYSLTKRYQKKGENAIFKTN